jgi:hypothetical protein
MTNKINRVLALGFNPREGSEEIKYIFNDGWMCFFWLAIKQGHVVSQYFDLDCIRIGGMARRGLKSPRELWDCFGWASDPAFRSIAMATHEREFREELWELSKKDSAILWYIKGQVLRHKEHGLIRYTGDTQRRADDQHGPKNPIFLKPDQYNSLVMIEDLEKLSLADDEDVSNFEELLCQSQKT